MVTITPISAFRDNYIWLIRQGQEAIVVDPGDATPVLQYLEKHALTLRAILITHHHADHQGGVMELQASTAEKGFPIRVFGPAIESITGVTDPLSGEEILQLPWTKTEKDPLDHVKVLATPGHTRGHLSYYIAGIGALFCGDTLFGAGCGRLFEGTHAQLKSSLDTLAALPDDTRVYCAHEYTAANLRFAQAVEKDNPDITTRIFAVEKQRQQQEPSVPSTIGEEKKTNPFLRCEVADVVRAIEKQQGEQGASFSPPSPLAVFTALREWKNIF